MEIQDPNNSNFRHLNIGPSEKKMKVEDFTEFDHLIDELADELKIARHPDSSIVLKAARLMLEGIIAGTSTNSIGGDMNLPGYGRDTKMAKQSDPQELVSVDKSSHPRPASDRTIQRSKLTLSDVPLPKTLLHNDESEDKVIVHTETLSDDLNQILGRASRTLKLLYLDDQRQLQDQVNELLTSIQAITANPKTNSRLMAVGR